MIIFKVIEPYASLPFAKSGFIFEVKVLLNGAVLIQQRTAFTFHLPFFLRPLSCLRVNLNCYLKQLLIYYKVRIREMALAFTSKQGLLIVVF